MSLQSKVLSFIFLGLFPKDFLFQGLFFHRLFFSAKIWDFFSKNFFQRTFLAVNIYYILYTLLNFLLGYCILQYITLRCFLGKMVFILNFKHCASRKKYFERLSEYFLEYILIYWLDYFNIMKYFFFSLGLSRILV